MRKRLLIVLAVLTVVVLVLFGFDRGYSFYQEHRRQQRERQAELLGQHFDAYVRAHGRLPPADIPALVSWRPLEPELRRLVETGHVTYRAFIFEPGSYRYEYSIDGQGSTVMSYR